MKCPKCGYTSFEHLDSCKKCGAPLAEHKTKFSIRSLLLAGLAPSPSPEPANEEVLPEEETPLEQAPAEAAPNEASQDATDFGFDFLDESPEPEEESPPPLDDLFADEADPLTDQAPAAGHAPAAEVRDAQAFDFDDAVEALGTPEEPEDFSFDDFDIETSPFETAEKETAKKKPSDKESPPDPFESRGPAVAGPVPASSLGHKLTDEDRLSQPAENEPAPWTELPTEPPLPFGADLPAVLETTTDPTDPLPELAVRPAPLTVRLAAFLADLLVLSGIFVLFLVVGKWLLHPASGDGLLPDLRTMVRLSTPYFLLMFVIAFSYFTLFHLFLSQTPGKILFGLEIETEGGQSLGPVQAFLRSVGGLASFCLLGGGFLASLFDSEGRGLNDRLAGTRVVYCRRPSDQTELSEVLPA